MLFFLQLDRPCLDVRSGSIFPDSSLFHHETIHRSSPKNLRDFFIPRCDWSEEKTFFLPSLIAGAPFDPSIHPLTALLAASECNPETFHGGEDPLISPQILIFLERRERQRERRCPDLMTPQPERSWSRSSRSSRSSCSRKRAGMRSRNSVHTSSVHNNSRDFQTFVRSCSRNMTNSNSSSGQISDSLAHTRSL